MLRIVSSLFLTFALCYSALGKESDSGSKVEDVGKDVREQFYLMRGVSEDFYSKWIEPLDFHLKWQAGPSLSRYRSIHERITHNIDAEPSSTRMNVNLDLVGVYLRQREGGTHLFGINLGVNSDNIDSDSTEVQVDQYIGALSWVSFWSTFNSGFYHRLDAGLIWYDIYRVSSEVDSYRDRGAGAGLKAGIGHSWNLKKSSFTVELTYSNSFVNQAFAHNLSLGFGFIL